MYNTILQFNMWVLINEIQPHLQELYLEFRIVCLFELTTAAHAAVELRYWFRATSRQPTCPAVEDAGAPKVGRSSWQILFESSVTVTVTSDCTVLTF